MWSSTTFSMCFLSCLAEEFVLVVPKVLSWLPRLPACKKVCVSMRLLRHHPPHHRFLHGPTMWCGHWLLLQLQVVLILLTGVSWRRLCQTCAIIMPVGASVVFMCHDIQVIMAFCCWWSSAGNAPSVCFHAFSQYHCVSCLPALSRHTASLGIFGLPWRYMHRCCHHTRPKLGTVHWLQPLSQVYASNGCSLLRTGM